MKLFKKKNQTKKVSFHEPFEQLSTLFDKRISDVEGLIDRQIIKTIDYELTNFEKLKKWLINCIYDYILMNPESFHKDTRSVSEARKDTVKERDDYICQICQRQFNAEDLEIDHIFPYSLGGSNEEYNLMALCHRCNQDKARSLEYYQSKEGKKKLKINIGKLVETIDIIHNFGKWLEKIGDMRRRHT